MKFTLKNVGKINQAEIELQGITVVAGENNTGKSTIGKMLFCVFDAFCEIEEQIKTERRDNISRLLTVYLSEQVGRSLRNQDWASFAEYCVERREYFLSHPDELNSELRQLYKRVAGDSEAEVQQDGISSIFSRFYNSLKISDDEIMELNLKKRLQDEFGMKVGYLNTPEEKSEISLEIKSNKIEFQVLDNASLTIKKYFNLVKEICYIDDPFVLDELDNSWIFIWGFSNEYDHRNNLLSKLARHKKENAMNAVDELVVQKKLTHIFESMAGVCDGELLSSGDELNRTYVYKTTKLKGELKIANLSTGIKSFVILRTLLLNGFIDDNGIIIMDEPEIHLHPEWQLRFAEMIVLIQKEFNANILLNTHSPYFLNAIQVFSKKYGIKEKCRYYLTEECDGRADIRNVTYCTEAIYEKLARPLQELENLEYWNEHADK